MNEREEGQKAYWRGKDLRDNPYPRNSLSSREWDTGYWDAVDEDEDGPKLASTRSSTLSTKAYLARSQSHS